MRKRHQAWWQGLRLSGDGGIVRQEEDAIHRGNDCDAHEHFDAVSLGGEYTRGKVKFIR